jgi:class 3 adenylate cyclase
VTVSTAPAATRFAAPESYTPKHLAERILTSRAALEGERKQVTVLFADLKGSMELLADRDPEEARRLLDPVVERMMEAVHHYEGTVNQARTKPRRSGSPSQRSMRTPSAGLTKPRARSAFSKATGRRRGH